MFLNTVNVVTLRNVSDCMLVKVFTPNKIAHGVLCRMVCHPMSFGMLQRLKDCMINMVAVFCNSTKPPLNGILSTMALLMRIIATDTVVDIMQTAEVMAIVCMSFIKSVPPPSSSSSTLILIIIPTAFSVVVDLVSACISK